MSIRLEVTGMVEAVLEKWDVSLHNEVAVRVALALAVLEVRNQLIREVDIAFTNGPLHLSLLASARLSVFTAIYGSEQ